MIGGKRADLIVLMTFALMFHMPISLSFFCFLKVLFYISDFFSIIWPNLFFLFNIFSSFTNITLCAATVKKKKILFGISGSYKLKEEEKTEYL